MKTVEKVVPGEENQVVGEKINAHRLDEFGREIVDARPIAPPIGFKPQESIFEQMRTMMRAASLEAAQAGAETLEEANDFYIEDDPLSGVPPGEYDFDEDHELELQNLIRGNSERIEGSAPPAPAETPPSTPPNVKKSPPTPTEPLGGSEGGE